MTHTIKYSIGRYQICINFWFLIIFLLVQTLLNELGFWQLDRAKQKQYRIEQLAKGNQSIAYDLNAINEEQIEQFQSVELKLERLNHLTLLLDNKINNKQPGYHVLNICRDSLTGKHILVNRGWIFAGLDRNKIPEIAQPPLEWAVKARIYPLAEEAISTASAEIEKTGSYYRLPVLDQKIKAEIEKKTGLVIENYILRLNADTESVFNANWIWTNMTAEKHLGYAFQWFALALAFLVVSLIASIKKIAKDQ